MKKLIKYVVTLVVGLLLVLWIISEKGVFSLNDPCKIFHILADGFFAVGVVASGMGLLIFSSNEGTFDMLVYGVSTFFSMFKKKPERKYETFYDYRASRAEKKVGFGFMLICGLFFVLVSVVMYLLYRKYS